MAEDDDDEEPEPTANFIRGLAHKPNAYSTPCPPARTPAPLDQENLVPPPSARALPAGIDETSGEGDTTRLIRLGLRDYTPKRPAAAGEAIVEGGVNLQIFL